MSSVALLQGAQSLLQQAMTDALVLLSPPMQINDPIVLYFVHDGYLPDVLKGGGSVRRTHVMQVHLMVLIGGDDAESEYQFLGICDRVYEAFNQTKQARELYAAAQTSDLLPAQPGQVPYIIYQNGRYRHRSWTLHATEGVQYDWR
jgi:hypothetical protein